MKMDNSYRQFVQNACNVYIAFRSYLYFYPWRITTRIEEESAVSELERLGYRTQLTRAGVKLLIRIIKYITGVEWPVQ